MIDEYYQEKASEVQEYEDYLGFQLVSWKLTHICDNCLRKIKGPI